MSRHRIAVVRGHQVTPWELAQWERLPDRFDVTVLATRANRFDYRTPLATRRVRTLRGALPPGRAGDLLVRVPGDRYIGLPRALAGSDLVHAQELGYWYSAQAARAKARGGFKLVLTVWETLPFLSTYRNARTRPYRAAVLAATDRFLAVTARARDSLVLEGADPARIVVHPPGVDTARFASATAPAPDHHRILSVGRLVWEKGHQDAIRALAALRRGVVEAGDAGRRARLIVAGTGPEGPRLRRYADELGVGDAVEIHPFAGYDAMPALYAGGSCLVLASLPLWHWEEQFGMVIAEALASGLPVLGSTSGAIPEVLGGAGTLFAAGDWLGLAWALRDGPLAGPPGRRATPAGDGRYDAAAAAERLASIYDDVLAS